MTGGTVALTLDADALLDLGSTENVLTVLGDVGDTVRIAGDFVDQGVTGGFARFQLGAATLFVDSDIQVLQLASV